MTAAQDIEELAARWVLRSEDTCWSQDDERDLQDWLDESMAHKAAFWRLRHGWRAADRIAALGTGTQPRRHRLRPRLIALPGRRISAAVAAGLLAIIGSGALRHMAPPPSVERQQGYRTALGDHRAIALEDGSRIELNTATDIRTSIRPNARVAWLDRGEAFFDIRHEPDRPFVVHAGTRTITVLGTRFSVRRDPAGVTVAVLSGSVRISDGDAGSGTAADAPETDRHRSATIVAGDVAIARGAATLVTPPSGDRVDDLLAWRNGKIAFDGATLAEAASEFNRYSVRKIRIVDPGIARIRIGGVFEANRNDAFLRLLHDAYGLKLVETPTGVSVTR